MGLRTDLRCLLVILVVVVGCHVCEGASRSQWRRQSRLRSQDVLASSEDLPTDQLQYAGCCKGGKCVKNKETRKTECQCPPGQGWYFKEGGIFSGDTNECRNCNCGGKQHNCTFNPGVVLDGKKCICDAGYGLKKEKCAECGCGGPSFNCTFSCSAILGCSKTCVCGKGYKSKNGKCEATDPCIEKPCKNGATCVPLKNKQYSCTCAPGYTGKYCETRVDPCMKKPCGSGGTCIPGKGLDYTCRCPPTRTGKTCETKIDPCAKKRCGNGGLCIPGKGLDYTCLCLPTHTGKTCETKIDPCAKKPCGNGGTCFPRNDLKFACRCPPTHTGKTCETKINPRGHNPCKN